MKLNLRNSWCDCIRGYAILLVCIAHSFYVDPFHGVYGMITKYFKGDTGVFMFYVLSGFLVTGILASETESQPKLAGRAQAIGHFFARRIFRLQPSYLVFLACYALSPHHADALSWWVLLLPLSNWFAGPYLTWHLKTLHIEETYYIFIGGCSALARRSLKPMLWTLLFLGPVGRAILFLLAKTGYANAVWWSDRFLPVEAFAVGGLLVLHLATVQRSFLGQWIARMPARAFILAMLTLLISAALRPVKPFSYGLIFTWPLLFSFSSAVMILSGLEKPRFVFAGEWLRKLGLASYTVYLFQQFTLGPWMENFGASFQWLTWFGALAGTVLLIPLWYHFIEKPLTDWGARLFPRIHKTKSKEFTVPVAANSPV